MIKELESAYAKVKSHLNEKALDLIDKYGNDSHLLGLIGNRNQDVANFELACYDKTISPELLSTYIDNMKATAIALMKDIDNMEETLLRNKPELRLVNHN